MRGLTTGAILFAVAAAMCGAWVALAQANPVQTSSQGSPAQSQVYGDQSSSSAAKGGNARVGNVSATSAPSNATAKGGRGGQGGNGQGGNVVNNINGGGAGYGYPSNPRLAASAIAPTIISGGCTGGGASAALQLPGIGLGGGAVKTDRVCQLHMIGEDAAARELLCQQDDIRRAFSAAGEPCAADLKPMLIAPTPVSTTKYPYDYCQTRHAGDKDQHRECDHKLN